MCRTLADLQLPHSCREVCIRIDLCLCPTLAWLPSCVELQVVDKSADSVLDEVESTIYQVAQQILNGEGFSYGIPSRAKGNQMYIPQLDRIVLKDSKSQRPFASTSTCRKAVITTRILQLIHELCLKRIHVTKRDLFYTDVKLFEVHSLQLVEPGFTTVSISSQHGCTCTPQDLHSYVVPFK